MLEACQRITKADQQLHLPRPADPGPRLALARPLAVEVLPYPRDAAHDADEEALA